MDVFSVGVGGYVCLCCFFRYCLLLCWDVIMMFVCFYCCCIVFGVGCGCNVQYDCDVVVVCSFELVGLVMVVLFVVMVIFLKEFC